MLRSRATREIASGMFEKPSQVGHDRLRRKQIDDDASQSHRRGLRWVKAGLTRPAVPDDATPDPVPQTAVERPREARPGYLAASIASLVANPSSASEVPIDRIPALVAELASEQTALSALQGALTTRLLASQAKAVSPDVGDRLLTADEVAVTLGVTRRWVQRRARRLPFARRISEHAIRYSESGLRRWMSNRKLSAAGL